MALKIRSNIGIAATPAQNLFIAKLAAERGVPMPNVI
jgi:antitoxin component of RelBE/YafQ-DinJ toxin-antitoxin module